MAIIPIYTLASFIDLLENRNLVNFDILGDTDKHFENRFKIQKYVYLARYFGLDVGYDYSLYLHGPYSRDLAEDYYNLAMNHVFGIALPASFDKEGFLNFVNGMDNHWLEASSTLISLNKAFKDKTSLVRRITNMKPHIPIETINAALNELEKRKLVTYA